MIQERNYLDIYTFDKWTGSTIPRFGVGDTFTPSCLDMISGQTAPPPLLSESDLIAEMDKRGIGTDATIAEHIKKILTRNYATKTNQVFSPTSLGLALVQGYRDIGFELHKPNLRAQMEQDCTDISRGLKSKQEVVDNCIGQMRHIFHQIHNAKEVLERAVGQYYAEARTTTAGGEGDLSSAAVNEESHENAATFHQHNRGHTPNPNIQNPGRSSQGMAELFRVIYSELFKNQTFIYSHRSEYHVRPSACAE